MTEAMIERTAIIVWLRYARGEYLKRVADESLSPELRAEYQGRADGIHLVCDDIDRGRHLIAKEEMAA